MALTTTKDVIIAEVLADMVREELPHKLAFGAFLDIDDTLVGRPGDTVKITKWKLIGEAKDVAEGEEIDYSQLKAEEDEMKIKKIGAGLELTDEMLLSAYGKPLEEAKEQLALAMARKIDSDALKMFQDEGLKVDKATVELSYDTLVDALVGFGEKVDVDRVMYVTASQYAKLRKDPNWIKMADLTGVPVGISGIVGKMSSVFIKVSAHPALIDGETVKNPIMEFKAGKLILKRDMNLETARNIKKKTTELAADQHLGMHIKDETKAMVLITKNTASKKPVAEKQK